MVGVQGLSRRRRLHPCHVANAGVGSAHGFKAVTVGKGVPFLSDPRQGADGAMRNAARNGRTVRLVHTQKDAPFPPSKGFRGCHYFGHRTKNIISLVKNQHKFVLQIQIQKRTKKKLNKS